MARGDIDGYAAFDSTVYHGGRGNVKDCAGMTFDRLYVLERDGTNRRGAALWKCECSCGTIVRKVLGNRMREGYIRSCGCFRVETSREWGLQRGKNGKKDAK